MSRAHPRPLAVLLSRPRAERGLTDNGWEIAPGSFTPLLLEAGALGLPVLVTENGLADADDSRRASFLRSHVEAVLAAERAGVRVAGYLHWSLVDNFEWLDGYGPKFGLYAVDRETLDRRERPSVAVFREIGKSFLDSELPKTPAQKSVHI